MNDDRELLEWAAKAAGIDYKISENGSFLRVHEANRLANVCWNPLTDDGDAMRLEAALMLNVTWSADSVEVDSDRNCGCAEFYADHKGDKQAARRRAGARAAAAIGKEMT